MSILSPGDKARLERLFDMKGGYVLNFSNAAFGGFVAESVDIDIYSEEYGESRMSKANKLRRFWRIEDDLKVGKLLEEMVELAAAIPNYSKDTKLIDECREIARRLQGNGVNLGHLRKTVEPFNSTYITKQIHRMEQAVDNDPDLAIGTAKELIETCCKSILEARGKAITGIPDIPTLTKATFKELDLVPESVHEASRGKDTVKRILSNLSTIGNGLAELRGLYGTGHGKEHQTSGLHPRHAKLAIGTAATLVTFLFETHKAK
jgi:hypothetical protein